jgi:regulator of protease activity HflC (stomatin/prohibitin superfamily)
MMKMRNESKVIVGGVAAVFVGIIALAILGGSFYTVDQGERGVVLRNGAVVGTAEPGLGFKLPIVDSVRSVTVQTQARLYENVMVYSRDQQTAELQVSVNYRLPSDQVEQVYSDFGGQSGIVTRLLDRQVPENVKNVFGRFNAVTAIQERGRLTFEIQEAIQKAVTGPMIIESVQIENIDFSDAYEASIEQRMLAEVEVQKVQQNAEREKVQAEIKVIQAQADADARVAQATAEAKAIRLRGEAEAQAIRVRGQALAQNPGLVNLVAAENWDGKLPSTMVPGSAVPFVNVDKK